MKKIAVISLILVFSFLFSVIVFNVSAAEKIDFVPEIKSGRVYGIAAGSTKTDVEIAYYGRNVQLKDKNGAVVEDDNTKIGTGYVLNLDGVYYATVVMGDVDSSGTITADDYINVKRAVLGTGSLDSLQTEAAGAENGKLRAIDYIKVKRAYFGTYDINHKYTCEPYLPDMSDNEIIVSGWY